MSTYEVKQPIINSPFREPERHWIINYDRPAELGEGRRSAGYWVRQPSVQEGTLLDTGTWIEFDLVNRIRERVKLWREDNWAGATEVTKTLLLHWTDEDRQMPLFFAQREAIETIIFLKEARADYLQGISVPAELEKPMNDGYRGFQRYALKMATGSGKTMVMALLCVWSILNRREYPKDNRFSDQVLVVCPNVTIRDRLQELIPGDGSIYEKRELVPKHLLPRLFDPAGKVAVTNWHLFEPRILQEGGTAAAVVKRGKKIKDTYWIYVGKKTEVVRGKRFMTDADLKLKRAAGLLGQIDQEDYDKKTGLLTRVQVTTDKYVETDNASARRILKELGIRRGTNILVLNDEAHHAYRIQQAVQVAADSEDDADDLAYEKREATVWVDGLDRINRHGPSSSSAAGLNFAVDFSATPFYLNTVGEMANRPFAWIVSDFGLVDAIESGLVKVPQLPLSDPAGGGTAQYYNLWHWILGKLESGEKGGSKGEPKPEAVVKWADQPITLMASRWREEYQKWNEQLGTSDLRRPVFIIVCKNTTLAKLLYEWIAENKPPKGCNNFSIHELRNSDGELNTIRVDSKVIQEDPAKEAQDLRQRWMRFTLDTVGKREWPTDDQKRPVYPPDFEETAKKLGKPLNPPGRDIRCIVSVGMLTEGWDCKTVTHIVGLRPFTSQLLCEQVVGRGLRRANYDPDYTEDPAGRFAEEVAQVVGVPFEIVPFKASGNKTVPVVKKEHVYALPEKSRYEITFPRVEGYYREIRQRITVDWNSIPALCLSQDVPTELNLKLQYPGNSGRKAMFGPGSMDKVSLDALRDQLRESAVIYELASRLCIELLSQEDSVKLPRHELLRQVLHIVKRYVDTKVNVYKPNRLVDLHFAPYFGWVLDVLRDGIRPDTSAGETPELPRFETNRGPGSSAEVDFFTAKPIQACDKTHVNYTVFDTDKWEQSAAYYIDTNELTAAFIKNDQLGLAIPYFWNARSREYIPDFVVRVRAEHEVYVIVETKGYDPMKEHKRHAAKRWCTAVSATGTLGHWEYALLENSQQFQQDLSNVLESVLNPRS